MNSALRPCDEYKTNLDKILNSHFYQKHQQKNQANSLLSKPKCDSNGFFQPVQCTENHCCCVEKNTGKPISSTTTSITNKGKVPIHSERNSFKEFGHIVCRIRVVGKFFLGWGLCFNTTSFLSNLSLFPTTRLPFQFVGNMTYSCYIFI